MPTHPEAPTRERIDLRTRAASVRGRADCKTVAYDIPVKLWWTDDDADYIRSRSRRYRGARDLEPGGPRR